jgi:AcrR family transcriptional regulator
VYVHTTFWNAGHPQKKGRAVAKQRKDDELPGFLEVLWQRAGRQAREPQQRLSLERIVDAAIQMAESDGLPSLSMARLAQRLGCATMALYRHVASKDELQALMTDAAPGPPPSIPGSDDWAEGLTRWARALRDVYLRHPWILQIPVRSPPLEPGQLAWFDCGLRVLEHTRLAPADKLSVILMLLYYVRGEAQLSSGLRQASEQSKPTRGGTRSYGQRLAQLIDSERFPALAALIEAGVFENVDVENAASDFEFGLACILAGIDVLVRRHERTKTRNQRRRVRPLRR